ncbi:MAG: OmpH family outer membrane protein [Firmicutes bacterium]|nr:OmpH family outer membrane protein [Bacillota bacterium]
MDKKKKLLLAVAALLLTALLLFAVWQWLVAPRYQAGQIGYIDTTRLAEAYDETAEFQKLYQELEQEFNDFGQTLQEETAEQLEALETEEEKAKKGKNATVQSKIAEEYGAKRRELYAEQQKRMESKRAELNNRLNQNLRTRINEAAAKVAKQEGVSVILLDQVVYYGGKDLTAQVLTGLVGNGEGGND